MTFVQNDKVMQTEVKNASASFIYNIGPRMLCNLIILYSLSGTWASNRKAASLGMFDLGIKIQSEYFSQPQGMTASESLKNPCVEFFKGMWIWAKVFFFSVDHSICRYFLEYVEYCISRIRPEVR